MSKISNNRDIQQSKYRSHSASTRRQALRGIGTIAGISLAGCLGQDDPDSEDEDTAEDNPENGSEEEQKEEVEERTEENLESPENGAVVFVYDDGPIEDYTKAFPVHEEFDAPATTGIVTEWIGQSADWMNVKHLKELAAAGWEICSHTTDHGTVASFEIQVDIEASDRQIRPEEIRHGHHGGKEIELTDGDRSVIRTVEELDGEGEDRYIVLTEPVGESFEAGETVIRYPEEYMHELLGDSKRELEELGFEVDTFLAPYDQFNTWSMEFVPEYYAGVANANHGERINYEGFNPFETQRHYFIEFVDRSIIESDLDEIANQGALGVFGAHTVKEEVTEELIRETHEWINERGIEVMTLRDAFAHFTESSNLSK